MFSAVILLFVGACVADNSNEITEYVEATGFNKNEKVNNENAKVEGHEIEETQQLEKKMQEFNGNHEFDVSDTTEEDVAIDLHVRELDTAREALLQFAKDLRKGKNITNSFLKVIDGFEKEIANFQAVLGRRTIKPDLVKKLETFIKEAAQDRKANAIILRALTAQGLFLAQKTGGKSSSKRNLRNAAIKFLEKIKKDMGKEVFEEYMQVSGLVTLIFVIDDTGSMWRDIKSAIAIATQIVQHKREYSVDYILSPFNDPTTGPITTEDKDHGDDFVAALKSLSPHGGGDCPELAFKGMIDALDSGPEMGSSMYVFTDVSPKDGTPANVTKVIEMANDLDVPINFFSNGHCGSPSQLAPFHHVAQETGGLVYPLDSAFELRKLKQLVANNLENHVYLPGSTGAKTTSGRRKRATGSEYTISVDDSIDKIFITVTTENSGAGINLVDPKGSVAAGTRTALAKAVIYEIPSPVPGVYKLFVPSSAGKHKHKVNAISATNIDFGYYYAHVPKRGRNRIPVPLQQPLQGYETHVFITVAGAEFVTSTTLSIKVVNSRGTVHEGSLRPVGTSGVRYIFKFTPPSGNFKLELHGRTRKGNEFVRISAREDKAVPVILRLSYTPKSNVLPRSKTTTLRFQIQRGHIGAPRESYTVSVNDESGYGKVVKTLVNVRRGRIGFARIAFAVPADAPKEKSRKVEVLLTKKGETKPTASLRFYLLIV